MRMTESGDIMEIVLVAIVAAYMFVCRIVFDMRVAYVLPKCRFISVSANFGQTLYVLFLGKVMPNFCMTLMHACLLFIILLLITV